MPLVMRSCYSFSMRSEILNLLFSYLIHVVGISVWEEGDVYMLFEKGLKCCSVTQFLFSYCCYCVTFIFFNSTHDIQSAGVN